MVGKPVVDFARFVPAYRLVSAVASLLFVLVVAGDLLSTGMLRTADQAVPVVAEYQESEPAMEMEAPAAKAVEDLGAVEGESFALQVEPTTAVAGESELETEVRAEKSAPPPEPEAEIPPADDAVGEALVEELPVAEAEVSEESGGSPPAEEAPLMLAVPAPEEPLPEDEALPIEPGSPHDLDEAAAEPPGEDPAGAQAVSGETQEKETLQGTPMSNQADQGDLQDTQPGTDQPRELSRTGWNPIRIAEVSLVLVALGFGLLAWFNRTRG
jgi:hypothetical protein